MLNFLKYLSHRVVLGLVLVLSVFTAISQPSIESQNLELTFNKTSSIVFPAVITSVDRGSRDVLAQKARGVNNVLQLKAGRLNFKDTNLTVITADGKLHHFLVRYAEHPASFTIQISEPTVSDSNEAFSPLLFQTEMTSADLESASELILDKPDQFRLCATSHDDMKLSLQGIYIQDNVMFYHLRIANKSNIPFTTEMLRFYIKDRQKAKRTASQEVAQVPLHQYGNVSEVDGLAAVDVVVALQKFTIPDAKVLIIEWMERSGGRHLQLAVKNRKIISARAILADK